MRDPPPLGSPQSPRSRVSVTASRAFLPRASHPLRRPDPQTTNGEARRHTCASYRCCPCVFWHMQANALQWAVFCRATCSWASVTQGVNSSTQGRVTRSAGGVRGSLSCDVSPLPQWRVHTLPDTALLDTHTLRALPTCYHTAGTQYEDRSGSGRASVLAGVLQPPQPLLDPHTQDCSAAVYSACEVARDSGVLMLRGKGLTVMPGQVRGLCAAACV